MPKVNDEYIQNKREILLDAAQRVCNRKCIYDVTMRDIIVESGVSQGGIYCYFKNIDEVFAALINRFTEHSSLADGASKVLLSSMSVSQAIHELCILLTEYMVDIASNYGKYIYELNFLYLHYPERYEQIKHQLKEQIIISDFKNSFLAYLTRQIETGCIQPSVPVEYLILYWNSTYEGAINTITLSVQNDSSEIIKTIKMIMSLLEQTIKCQLKISEEK